MRRPVTLMAGQFGSRHFGTRPYLAEALQSTRKDRPTALYIGAANGDDDSFGTALCTLIEAAGAGAITWPKLAKRRSTAAKARTALASVDFVFIGGGDVEAGMEVLRRAGIIADLRAAAARGAVFAGMSAGAIMLGERWVRWPHDEAGDDEAETFDCLGLVPCSLDTHGEGDDWRETRSFARVRARELERQARAYGVPSGGALIVSSSGRMLARGQPVPVFVARPHGAVSIKTTLSPKP
jgi:peptidase E